MKHITKKHTKHIQIHHTYTIFQQKYSKQTRKHTQIIQHHTKQLQTHTHTF